MEHVIERKPVSIFIPYAILVTALLSALITFVNKVELKPFEVEYPAEAFIAPGFSLPSLSGGQLSLEDYRGKVVFINFWATWCAPFCSNSSRTGRVIILREKAVTSARRWMKEGVAFTTARNIAIASLFLLGFPPAQLGKWYLPER